MEDEPVAIRPVLQPWTTSANGTTYDGTNAWAQRGGRAIGTDIGGYVDLVDSVADDWMDFDVTEAVQAAMAAGPKSRFADDLHLQPNHGSNCIHVHRGQRQRASLPHAHVGRRHGCYTDRERRQHRSNQRFHRLGYASHALQADRSPTFSWTYSGTTTATGWRVFIQADANNDMAGLYTYDSRTTPAALTPPT